jgi:hypothetical protein
VDGLVNYSKFANKTHGEISGELLKQYELTKNIREGYLSAIQEMAIGAGEFSKIIGTQEMGVTQLMDAVDNISGHKGRLNTNAVGGRGGGAYNPAVEMTGSGARTRSRHDDTRHTDALYAGGGRWGVGNVNQITRSEAGRARGSRVGSAVAANERTLPVEQERVAKGGVSGPISGTPGTQYGVGPRQNSRTTDSVALGRNLTATSVGHSGGRGVPVWDQPPGGARSNLLSIPQAGLDENKMSVDQLVAHRLSQSSIQRNARIEDEINTSTSASNLEQFLRETDGMSNSSRATYSQLRSGAQRSRPRDIIGVDGKDSYGYGMRDIDYSKTDPARFAAMTEKRNAEAAQRTREMEEKQSAEIKRTKIRNEELKSWHDMLELSKTKENEGLARTQLPAKGIELADRYKDDAYALAFMGTDGDYSARENAAKRAEMQQQSDQKKEESLRSENDPKRLAMLRERAAIRMEMLRVEEKSEQDWVNSQKWGRAATAKWRDPTAEMMGMAGSTGRDAFFGQGAKLSTGLGAKLSSDRGGSRRKMGGTQVDMGGIADMGFGSEDTTGKVEVVLKLQSEELMVESMNTIGKALARSTGGAA